MRVPALYFDGRPSWRVAEELLWKVFAEIGEPDLPVDREQVAALERAQGLGFRGSPTVLSGGSDPVLDETAPIGLLCRLSRAGEAADGAPSL